MKQRISDRVQKAVINPLDKVAFALGTPPLGDALLETIRRRTGQARGGTARVGTPALRPASPGRSD
jgi:hypothetical protein